MDTMDTHQQAGNSGHGEKKWTARELLQTLGPEEEVGYDAPFSTFTWERWLEMQGMLVTGCTRFQRAVEQKQPRLIALFQSR